MRNVSLWLVLLMFLVAVGAAFASRNSSGTYSLPAGNPVVSGTTITASWANSTHNDIATELTNSLDRNGRGSMLAPLKLMDGTVSAPGVTFSSEQSTGLYRAGAGDVRLSVLGADEVSWDTSGETVSLPLVCSEGVSSTGVGSGAGVSGIGGSATNGVGVLGTGGAANGVGVKGIGVGTGTGVFGQGGSAGGAGVLGQGAGTAPGVQATAAGVSNASSRFDALDITNGDVDMHNVVNPGSTVAFTNRLTPSNLVKAWAQLHFNGTAWSVSSGFNIASVATGASPNFEPTVTLAAPMASVSYAIVCSGSAAANAAVGSSISSASAFNLLLLSGRVEVAPPTGSEYHCLVMGDQ